MRVVLLTLLLVLTACSVPAESADTTTTTTKPATTTNSETTTSIINAPTTTEPECVERDGVPYDSRGFVCPPKLKPGRPEDGPSGYRAGTYTTDIFKPQFSFTTDLNFKSSGENVYLTAIEESPSSYMAAISPEAAAEFRAYPYDNLDWIENLEVSSVQYWDYSGTQIDFSVGACQRSVNRCSIVIESLIWLMGWDEEDRVRLLIVDVPGGPIGFEVAAHQSRFPSYWTEVAEPILASIEFLEEGS